MNRFTPTGWGAVKVCGVRCAADAIACVDAGVRVLGLNCVEGARRRVDPAQLAAIRVIAADCMLVAVTQGGRALDVAQFVHRHQLDGVQLHGQEQPEFGAALRQTGLIVIRALPVMRVADASQWVDAADLLLVDGAHPGSGAPWSWRRLELPLPFWIAGGLNAENVRSALAITGAGGADTASGVETAGLIDPARVHDFAHAVHGALL